MDYAAARPDALPDTAIDAFLADDDLIVREPIPALPVRHRDVYKSRLAASPGKITSRIPTPVVLGCA
jgi:hypothetical protein